MKELSKLSKAYLSAINNKAIYLNMMTSIVENGVMTFNSGSFTLKTKCDLDNGFYDVDFLKNGHIEKGNDVHLEKELNTKELITKFTLSKNDIKNVVDAMRFVGNNNIRPVLTNVFIGENHIVSTNAISLLFRKSSESIKTADFKNSTPFYDVLIPSKFKNLLKLVKSSSMEVLCFKDRVVKLVCDEFSLVFRADNYNYVQNEALIPKSFNHTAIINIMKLKKALEDCKAYVKESKRVKFNFNKSTLIITAENLRKDKRKVIEFDIDFSGEPLEIGFDYKLILDYLKILDKSEKEIKIDLVDDCRAALFNSEYILAPFMV